MAIRAPDGAKNGEGKGGKYLEKGNIFNFFSEEKKNGEGKGGQILVKENIFLRRRKRRKIFADGKCSFGEEE